MTLPAVVAVIVAGFLAGTMNAVVGSGSLITFPVLLAIGFPPVTANISNTVGLAFGNLSGTIGYRRELKGQMNRLRRLTLPAIAGGSVGAVLLLSLPGRVFLNVVPALIIFAIVLVIVQPRLSERLQHGAPAWAEGVVLPVGVFLTAVYGGYFGASQGVILISLLSVVLSDDLQNLNGLKNALVMFVNGIAAVIFLFLAHIAWEPAVLVALSSIAGGQLGASVGRRLSPVVLRAVIVMAGIAAVIKLLI